MQLKTAFMILYLFPTTSWRLIFGVTLNVSEHFFFLSAKGKCAKNELVSSIGRGGGRAGEAEAPLNENFFLGGGEPPRFGPENIGKPFGLVQLPDTFANTLVAVIKDVLSHCNLPLAMCRGQPYDGTANMRSLFTV